MLSKQITINIGSFIMGVGIGFITAGLFNSLYIISVNKRTLIHYDCDICNRDNDISDLNMMYHPGDDGDVTDKEKV